MRRGKVIVVEGILGAGKSNFSKELGAALTDISKTPSKVFIEPATEKEEGGANPYLADYYYNPKRWAYTMQTHLLQTRFRMHLAAQYYVMSGDGHAVVDRSFYGDVAFLELQQRDGHLDPREYATYHQLYETMTSFVRLPTVCVRLLVEPEVAQKRIVRRAELVEERKCESVVSTGYLSRLDEEIGFVCGELAKGGVAIINEHWNQDRSDEPARQEAIHALARHIHNLPFSARPRELHLRRMG